MWGSLLRRMRFWLGWSEGWRNELGSMDVRIRTEFNIGKWAMLTAELKNELRQLRLKHFYNVGTFCTS